MGAGILSAALIVAGFVLVGLDSAGSDSTRAEVVADLTDDAARARQGIGLVLMGLGGVCFLPFLSHLRIALARSAGERSALPGAAFAAGVVLVGTLFVSAALAVAVSSAADYFDAYRVDPDVALTTLAASFYLDGLAAMAGGALVGAVSIVAHRERLLPRWLTVVGPVVAVVSLAATLLSAWVIIEVLWIAVAGGLLARRSSLAASTPAPGSVAGAATSA